ncbi:hypothetical protein M9H77_12112 [Catharanthus roseus]|uniref:Uncharacterized protein n=1 Tax=Catharanthus roseus TaxID=4058 RepID=A0ACC0BGK7_CATRO|nr:hypothetical protein M9H77_12112 [Catharanthus roseus]
MKNEAYQLWVELGVGVVEKDQVLLKARSLEYGYEDLVSLKIQNHINPIQVIILGISTSIEGSLNRASQVGSQLFHLASLKNTGAPKFKEYSPAKTPPEYKEIFCTTLAID